MYTHVSSFVHLSLRIWENRVEIYGDGSKYVIITSTIVTILVYLEINVSSCQVSVDVTGVVI